MENIEFENCVMCGKKTNIPVDTHISNRTNYIECVGQLCHNCACVLHKKIDMDNIEF